MYFVASSGYGEYYDSGNLMTEVIGSYSEGDNVTLTSNNTIEFDVPEKYHQFTIKFRLYDKEGGTVRFRPPDVIEDVVKDGSDYDSSDDHFDILGDGDNVDITYQTTPDN